MRDVIQKEEKKKRKENRFGQSLYIQQQHKNEDLGEIQGKSDEPKVHM